MEPTLPADTDAGGEGTMLDAADEFRLQALLGELGWLEGLGVLDDGQREFLIEVRIGIEDALADVQEGQR